MDDSTLSEFTTYDLTPDEAFRQVAAARERCPVAHSDQLDGFDMLLRYDDVKRAARDWQTFSSTPSVVRPHTRTRAIIDTDPPVHTGWRKVVNLGVNPAAAARLESRVRADAARLIAGFEHRGTCDLVAEFAEQLPLYTICHLLGFDQQHTATIRQLSRRLLDTVRDPVAVQAAMRAFQDFAVAPVLERRGQSGDDFRTQLANAEMSGRLLTRDELGSLVMSLLLAGHETTVSSLTSLCSEVLRRPQLAARLRAHPDLIPDAVEEALRLHPPIFGFYRRATRDVTIDDATIAGQATTFLCWGAANRDPDTFDHPDEFDIDRTFTRHLTFGHGIHACPGASIARMEMQVALSELLARIPDIRLTGDDARHRFGGQETMSIPSLPATFTPVEETTP